MTEASAQTNGTETENVAAPAAAYYLFFDGTQLRATTDEATFTEMFPGKVAITTKQGIIDSEEVTLASIVKAYNQLSAKKVSGFKDRKIGAEGLDAILREVSKRANAAPADASEADKLKAALKPKKEAKEKKTATAGEGRSSPLAGKFWARSGQAIKGRRLEGTGVGIKALQYIIKNPGCSTQDYLDNSGGGRFVDLQYDLEQGNIVPLAGATPEARAEEIAALDKDRIVAEKVAADKVAADKKAAEEKKAAKEKEAADKKAKAEADKKAKAEADKKAAEEAAAKEAAEKEAAEKAAAKSAKK